MDQAGVVTPRTVHSVDELVDLLELEVVRVNEISGRRRDAVRAEDLPEQTGPAEMRVRQTIEGNEFVLRCRLDLNSDRAILTADVSARFRLREPVEKPADGILDAFVRTEGLPIVFPYLRVVAEQAARHIGVPAPRLKPYRAKDFAGLTQSNSNVDPE